MKTTNIYEALLYRVKLENRRFHLEKGERLIVKRGNIRSEKYKRFAAALRKIINGVDYREQLVHYFQQKTR